MSSDAQSFGQLLNKNSSLFYVICNREVVARAGAVLSNNDIPVTGPLDQGVKARTTDTQWTFYSATSILKKCRKVVLEKWFFKLRFFFSGQPLFSNLKKCEFMV